MDRSLYRYCPATFINLKMFKVKWNTQYTDALQVRESRLQETNRLIVVGNCKTNSRLLYSYAPMRVKSSAIVLLSSLGRPFTSQHIQRRDVAVHIQILSFCYEFIWHFLSCLNRNSTLCSYKLVKGFK